MTRRVLLPSEPEVCAALAQLRAANKSGIVTARDLARQLGLTNPTFWRHFPEIAQAVSDERRTKMRSAPASAIGSTTNNAPDGALRKENAKLHDQLEVAVAHIQRLTIDNHALRDQLESETHIVKLPCGGASD